jgi:hypothetical protein
MPVLSFQHRDVLDVINNVACNGEIIDESVRNSLRVLLAGYGSYCETWGLDGTSLAPLL